MKKPILISVLMTAYNRQSFIAEAIESVMASTYSNWELIVVDDCSADNTASIVQQYAGKDQRVRLFINEKNIGDYPNRNRAASYAKGELLKYVDSDDLIYPDTLQVMAATMEKYPEAGLGLSWLSTGQNNLPSVLLDARNAYTRHYFCDPIFFASPGQAIFRKTAFDAVGGFPEKRMVGDFEMWHKMALCTSIVLLPGGMYWVRRHGSQEITAQNRYILAYEKIKLAYLFSPQSPLSVEEALLVIRKRQRTVLKIFLRKLAGGRIREAGVRLRVFLFYHSRIRQRSMVS